MMTVEQTVTEAFSRIFGQAPETVVRAPGRVNLIGEHTDYNGGFVLPMAIDRAVWIALRPRRDGVVKVHSLDYREEASFALANVHKGEHGWIEYLKGVAWVLQEDGLGEKLAGWEGVLAGDVPLGAGLSSSAALEMATICAFAATSDFRLEPSRMAQLGQRAENKWVGVNCGIMDQLISAAGREGHALLIDCRSLQTELVPLPESTRVVLLDTATRRGLEGSAYNERRAQCEAACRFFGVHLLRDLTVECFEQEANQLDTLTRRRARHVISENARTLEAAEALKQGDAQRLGQLMNESHASLRDDFEVSCRELNIMAEMAQHQPSCHGARMTGGGFGGCAVALVEAKGAMDFAATVAGQYEKATGLKSNIYVCQAADGAKIVGGF